MRALFAIGLLVLTTPVSGQQTDMSVFDQEAPWDYLPTREKYAETGLNWANVVGPKVMPSNWLDARQQLFTKALSGHEFDVLVVPVQSIADGFRRPVRLSATAQLARLLGNETGLRVADPFMVWRALGGYQRQLSQQDVDALARLLRVKHLVQVYFGNDGTRKYVSVRYSAFPDRSPGQRRDIVQHFRGEELERQSGDYYAQDLLDKVMTVSGIRREPVALEYSETDSELSLPATLFPDAAQLNDLEVVYHLQLLAMLTPRREERTSELLFVKSLTHLENIRNDDENYRVLKARALFYLGHRPEALALLEHPESDAERALVATLNADLPELERLQAILPNPMQQLFVAIEVADLRYAFHIADETDVRELAASFATADLSWNYFVERRMRDRDSWFTPGMDVLLKTLDKYFSLPGAVDRNSSIRLLVGDATNPDGLLQEEVERYLNRSDLALCCDPSASRPSVVDYLDFLTASATDNVTRRAVKMAFNQGRPKAALSYLDDLSSVYEDNPAIAVMRAYSQQILAENSDVTSKQRLERLALQTAKEVLVWENGQSIVASTAKELVTVLDHSSRANVWDTDRPVHPEYYFRSFSSGSFKRMLAQLATANARYDLVVTLVAMAETDAEKAQIQNSVAHRFRGNPNIALADAQRFIRVGEYEKAERVLADAIPNQPGSSELHNLLGTTRVHLDDYEGAVKVFLNSPALAETNTDKLERSNSAYEAGSLFWWRGDLERARKFYEICAAGSTGSGAEYASVIRLALEAGDYETAVSVSALRGRRYSSSYAWRDYAGLLFLMGFNPQAWEAVDYFTNASTQIHIWETALVGQRVERMSDAQIIEWAMQDHLRNKKINVLRPSSMHLARHALMDRTPTAELADAVEAIDRTPRADGTRVEMSLSRGFVDGMIALHQKDYAEAFRLLSHKAGIQSAPYTAYAAGKADLLEELQGKFAGPSFEQVMARGVIAAFNGNHDEAVRLMRRAWNSRPFTEARIMAPEYQYAEVTEWLWEATGESRYREMALDWARKHQQIQPWFAWSYALEAKLTSDAQRRIDAAARAYQLDPASRRLLSLPGDVVASAKQQSETGNLFFQPSQVSQAGAL